MAPFLRPDRVILQDVLGQTGMLQFMQTKRDKVAVPTTIHCDHLIQARVEGKGDLKASIAENGEVYDLLRRWRLHLATALRAVRRAHAREQDS